MVFRWPKPLVFMVFGAHGIYTVYIYIYLYIYIVIYILYIYIYIFIYIYIYINIYIYIYTSYHQLAAAKVNTPCVDLFHGWHQRSGFFQNRIFWRNFRPIRIYVKMTLTSWWLQSYTIFTPNLGELIQFDEHIFPNGLVKDHQPVNDVRI